MIIFLLTFFPIVINSWAGVGGGVMSPANVVRTAEMFVPIILIMILAVLLTNFVEYIERRAAPWQTEITWQDGI